MTLHGIDASNWQPYLKPSKLQGIDFCIAKATEGDYYVDPYCDGFIQDCIEHGILFGFYHFNGRGTPEREAEFFYSNCTGYIGHGIPVLDYETSNGDDVEWCERFLQRFHDLSGVWPMIYMSEFHPIGIAKFAGSWIPEKCGLWCANYNRDYASWPTSDECPVNPSPWEFVAIWQFASDFRITGFHGNLDADLAFMDRDAWGKYAKPDTSTGAQPAAGKKTITGRVTIELD